MQGPKSAMLATRGAVLQAKDTHTTIWVLILLYLGGEVVETLATRGALLQAKDTNGYCALHIAAEAGNLEAIQVLNACSRMLTYAHVCSRMLTYAHVC